MNLQAGTKVLVEAVVDGEIDGDAVPVELTTWRGDTARQWFKDSTIHPFPGVQENRDSCHECKYSEQLDLICEILQKHHWIGKVKAIGRMEAVQALQEVLNTPPPSSAEQGEG